VTLNGVAAGNDRHNSPRDAAVGITPHFHFETLTGYGRAMNQGRQTGNALDPAIMSSVPGQRSTLILQPAGLHGESPHAASVWPDAAVDMGAAERHRVSIPIAVIKSGVEEGRSEPCPRIDYAAASGARQMAKKSRRNPAASLEPLRSQISCVESRRSIRMRELGVQIRDPNYIAKIKIR
jgi:hypothetical protein